MANETNKLRRDKEMANETNKGRLSAEEAERQLEAVKAKYQKQNKIRSTITILGYALGFALGGLVLAFILYFVVFKTSAWLGLKILAGVVLIPLVSSCFHATYHLLAR